MEGVVVNKFAKGVGARKDPLVVGRDGVEILLIQRRAVLDPKSQGELINMLDRIPRVATMGALLSLRNDGYTVRLGGSRQGSLS